MKSLKDILKDRKTSAKEALEIFDRLEIAPIDFMIGRWKGFEIETNHQMDGLLGPSGWYGKLFINPEKVHPLLFYANQKKHFYYVWQMIILDILNCHFLTDSPVNNLRLVVDYYMY